MDGGIAHTVSVLVGSIATLRTSGPPYTAGPPHAAGYGGLARHPRRATRVGGRDACKHVRIRTLRIGAHVGACRCACTCRGSASDAYRHGLIRAEPAQRIQHASADGACAPASEHARQHVPMRRVCTDRHPMLHRRASWPAFGLHRARAMVWHPPIRPPIRRPARAPMPAHALHAARPNGRRRAPARPPTCARCTPMLTAVRTAAPRGVGGRLWRAAGVAAARRARTQRGLAPTGDGRVHGTAGGAGWEGPPATDPHKEAAAARRRWGCDGATSSSELTPTVFMVLFVAWRSPATCATRSCIVFRSAPTFSVKVCSGGTPE